MNIISRILSGPAIAQLRELVVVVTNTRARLAGFAGLSNTHHENDERLRLKFFETLTEPDFAAWREARAQLGVTRAVSEDIGNAMVWRAEAALETDAVRELILTALADSAKALAKETDALARAEKERLAAAGVEDEGENPALAKLRSRIGELNECRDDLTSRDEVEEWKAHKNRYLSALGLR